jgi:alkanesulfonate monooxygenase
MNVTERSGRTAQEIEVFSSCPASLEPGGRAYLRQVAKVARWSEAHGCRGILVYSDNRLVDPWLLSEVIVQNTRTLAPLVAVQPVYMHPYAVATLVASFAYLHGRQLFLNWVAGGFKNDLVALADPTPHDQRYARLQEYATLVSRLTAGETVTFRGNYYSVERLALSPSVPPELRPVFMVSGSSPAGRAAAATLEARAVSMALPGTQWEAVQGAGIESGLRLGIVARTDREEAWRVAFQRFPPSRAGVLTRRLANKVSDSQWHAQLCALAEERAAENQVYWLAPFENYQSMCPYLVGSHEEVAAELLRYLSGGYRTFILDQPACEEDLAHSAAVFEGAAAMEATTAI